MAKTKKTSLSNLIKQNFTSIIIGVVIITLFIFWEVHLFAKSKNLGGLSTRQKVFLPESQEINTVNAADKPVQKIYKIKEGDTLWEIAEGAYGSGEKLVEIAQANSIGDSNLIYPDQKIVLPEVSEKDSLHGETSSIQTARVTRNDSLYVVEKGDHLWKIALEQYGDGAMWHQIASTNNLVDPDFISVGSKLQIPR